MQFSATLLVFFISKKLLSGEIRGMKKGVILSSKLPY